MEGKREPAPHVCAYMAVSLLLFTHRNGFGNDQQLLAGLSDNEYVLYAVMGMALYRQRSASQAEWQRCNSPKHTACNFLSSLWYWEGKDRKQEYMVDVRLQ